MASKNDIRGFRCQCEHDGCDYVLNKHELEKALNNSGVKSLDDLYKQLADEAENTENIYELKCTLTLMENIKSVRRFEEFMDYCEEKFGRQAAMIVWDRFVEKNLIEHISQTYCISKRWIYKNLNSYMEMYLDRDMKEGDINE